MSEFQNTQKEEDAAKREEHKARRDMNDLKAILIMPEGRRFIWRIMSMAKMFATCFTGNSSTFHNEGGRDLGLKILKWIMDAKPESFYQMMKENYSEAKSQDKGEK